MHFLLFPILSFLEISLRQWLKCASKDFLAVFTYGCYTADVFILTSLLLVENNIDVFISVGDLLLVFHIWRNLYKYKCQMVKYITWHKYWWVTEYQCRLFCRRDWLLILAMIMRFWAFLSKLDFLLEIVWLFLYNLRSYRKLNFVLLIFPKLASLCFIFPW